MTAWIIVIILFALYIFYQNRGKTNSENETIEQVWATADYHAKRVYEKSPNLENHLNIEREMVRTMEKDMIRLRERYKHNSARQREFAKDWMDFAASVQKVKFAREMLDVDMEDSAYDNYEDRTKEAYAVIHEVANRVMNELGNESHYKIIFDRLKKQSGSAQNVFLNVKS